MMMRPALFLSATSHAGSCAPCRFKTPGSCRQRMKSCIAVQSNKGFPFALKRVGCSTQTLGVYCSAPHAVRTRTLVLCLGYLEGVQVSIFSSHGDPHGASDVGTWRWCVGMASARPRDFFGWDCTGAVVKDASGVLGVAWWVQVFFWSGVRELSTVGSA